MKFNKYRLSNNKTTPWLIAAVWSLLITIFLYKHYSIFLSSNWSIIFLAAYPFITVLIYFTVFRWALPLLHNNGYPSNRSKAAWLAGALAGGIFLSYTIPVGFPTLQHLTITATGHKNTLALSNEVRVVGLYTPTGKMVDLSEFRQKDGWIELDGQLVAYQKFPAAMNWANAHSSGGLFKLVLIAHPWSGTVEIKWNGVTQLIDLYSSVGTVYQLTYHPKTAYTPILLMLLRLTAGSTIGLVLFLALCWLSLAFRTGKNIAATHHELKSPAFMLPMILAWGLYLLTLWPGVMSFDSVQQWAQLINRSFSDAHPASHTISMWLATRLWQTPAVIAMIQIVALSGVVAYMAKSLSKHKTKSTWILGIITILAISPLNGIMVNTLWKDIAYSTALVALSAVILKMVLSNGNYLVTRPAWLIMTAAAVLMALYRHNGLPVAILVLFCIMVVYRAYWRSIGMAVITVIAIVAFVRGPIYSLLQVDTSEDGLYYATLPMHHIAAHLDAGTPLNSSEKEFLSRIISLDDGWQYYCYTITNTYNDPRINKQFLDENIINIYHTSLKLALRAPEVEFKHLKCVSSIVWRGKLPPGGYLYYTPISKTVDQQINYIEDNNIDLTERSKIPFLLPAIYQFTSWLSTSDPFRPAFYLYLAIGCTVVASIRRKNIRFLLFLAPITIHSLILMVVSIVQDFRYQYGVYLVGLLSLMLLFLPEDPPKE